MSLPGAFASDNTAPVHPQVLEWLERVNHDVALPYGEDRYTREAEAWFTDQFGPGSHAFLCWNGTGANVLALRAMTRPYHGIVCAENAHINQDECGAPEMFTGCKLLPQPAPAGKLTASQVVDAVRNVGVEHVVQARVVSVSNPTELGTVYDVAELGAICEAAHSRGLLVHVDGSRIANATVHLQRSFRECTRDCGVDAISFGATKNGAMNAEAVVLFDDAMAAEMKYLRKQSTQLASKMRYVAAQILALADGDLWRRNAMQANAMAARLAEGVAGVPGVTIAHAVQANGVFAHITAAVLERLQRDFLFYVWDERSQLVRWMTNWATESADVDQFVMAIRGEGARDRPWRVYG